VAKFTAVIATAAFVARRARTLNRLSNLVGSTVLAGATIGLVLLQPDAGSAAILGFVWLGTLLVIGIKRRYLVGMFVAAALASLVAWQFVLAPYQKERLSTFFVSSERASAQGYNVRQAIIAVGSGGLFGRGPGSGSQSQLRFLPEASTDFVVAVIGEELGFVGLSLLFGLFFLLGVRLWLWLARCRDDFASFVLLGTVLLFAVELFMNAGMAVGLFPVVGIPLPLVSAGGSSLVAHLALLGVAQSVVREERAAGYRLSQVAVV
jgi:rod shape determining protein RodA